MLKKVSVVLLTVLVLTASIFAVGPWYNNMQANTNVPAQSQPLYQNLPEGASVSETTITGIIKEIEMVPGEGTEIVIDVEGKEYEVHAGPMWLYEDLEEGMEIEITGRIITTDEGTYIVVDKAIVDGQEIVVRENGFPVFGREGMQVRGRNTYTQMENVRRNVRNKMVNSPQNNVRQARGRIANYQGHNERGNMYNNNRGNCVYDVK
ncbi:MAG: hypothetical protein H0Z24_02405 [Thermosipho sp. (in: Bacteria)]|nr:hypothetical protein [Thermosipho sp. (in: thermotogales)]